MLTCLHVRNMGLIDEVTLNLHEQLNIFSGETGAGKSMLIDSIQFAIGNRTSKQMIRKGQQCAYVSLTFADHKGIGIAYIEENGFPYEASIIVMERTLYQSGRTVYKVNGVTCTRQVVRDLAALLIDVHGQHEPQSLLDVSKHVHMLDSFGDEGFDALKAEYQSKYQEWRRLREELLRQGNDDRKKLQLKDMLLFQVNEIESCHLKVGEEESLKEQYEVLSHAEKILQSCQRAYDYLENGEKGGMGASELVGRATRALHDLCTISPQLESLHGQLMSIEAELQDVSYNVRKYVDGIEYSPELLEEVQKRMDMIYRLKQKYGSSIKEILAYKATCEDDLEALDNSSEKKERLEKECAHLQEALHELAMTLTEKRQAIAAHVEAQIDKHLKDLQMPHATFKIAVTPLQELGKRGGDDVEFLIRTNLGEDMHPLCKIASGGEISRVMLAIKTVVVLGDTIETVIFDEIDTGISGLAAQRVAEKLGMISRGRQVICITHLPQIAAMGDTNYLIEKHTHDNQTTTHLTKLEDEGIHQELCRLMGGILTENTLQSAKEIKARTQDYKASIQ
ncbi:MAG: DNA repair protein RecN [Cellulosilyticaceae bacterium]